MKKLTATFLAIIMLIGLMVPAYAAGANTAAAADTSASQEATSSNTEDPLASELTPEQLLTTVTLFMRIRKVIQVETRLDGIIKAIGELKKDEKTIQLSSNDMLALCFYTIERGTTFTFDETTADIVCFWDYTNEAGDQLRISMNTDTIGWILTTTTVVNNATVTRTVTVN